MKVNHNSRSRYKGASRISLVALLLTILLLIHPMDWVREWQTTR